MNADKLNIPGLKVKTGAFLEKIGTLPRRYRLLICVAIFAVIGGGYYYFIFMPRYTLYEQVQNTYKSQVDLLATYKQRAAEIVKYEKKMAETMGLFNEAMKALPDKREIPSLLTAISAAGSKSGLAFHLFQPENEENKSFYYEIPVSIKVEGKYHQIADFFFQVLQLNRIVNINNVDVKSKQDGQKLEMSCRAVTYMFVESQAELNQDPKKGQTGKGRT